MGGVNEGTNNICLTRPSASVGNSDDELFFVAFVTNDDDDDDDGTTTHNAAGAETYANADCTVNRSLPLLLEVYVQCRTSCRRWSTLKVV